MDTITEVEQQKVIIPSKAGGLGPAEDSDGEHSPYFQSSRRHDKSESFNPVSTPLNESRQHKKMKIRAEDIKHSKHEGIGVPKTDLVDRKSTQKSVKRVKDSDTKIEPRVGSKSIKRVEENNRSISPQDIRQNKNLSPSHSSRNRQAVSPSQKSTRMISKASEGKQPTKDDLPQEIEEEGNSEFKDVNDKEQEPSEDLNSIPSANSDLELFSHISKSLPKHVPSKVSSPSKPKPSSNIDEEEVHEPTELDKSSLKLEESEGDGESDEEDVVDRDDDSDEDTPSQAPQRFNSQISVDVEILKKELQSQVEKLERKLIEITGKLQSNDERNSWV